MEMRELTIRKREGIGKGPARRLRRAGQVPATLYGGASPVNVAVTPKDVLRLIHGHEGSTQLFRVTFEGTTDAKMAIIRDMQFDPVSESLIHVDLQEVAMDRAIQVTVAVHHVGEAIGVKDTQGILEMVLREVRVSCLPGNIPEHLEADITNLAIHDVLHREGPEGPRGRARPERPQPGGRHGGPAGGRGSGGGGGGDDGSDGGRARGAHRAQAQGESSRRGRRKDKGEKKK